MEATIYHESDVFKRRIKQISRGGCLVLPLLPPLEPAIVKISFRLSVDMPFVNCRGEILYAVKDKGTGIAFTEISRFNQDLITEFFEPRVAAAETSVAP